MSEVAAWGQVYTRRRRKRRRRPSPIVLPPDWETLEKIPGGWGLWGGAAVPRRRRRARKGRVAAIRRVAARAQKSIGGGEAFRGVYYANASGLYRIFGDAEYRLFRSDSGPPAESDEPYATSATLPVTPADAFADGSWYISVSYFNGALDSGFLPLGPNGERYLRLDISSGTEDLSPPNAPTNWRIEAVAGGVVRIHAAYFQQGPLAADEWAISYTTNGGTPGTPPAGSPTIAVSMGGRRNLVLWSYDLPAQSDGTTVKVRLQTRRNDGTVESPDWQYSEGSDVLTAIADATGPDPILAGEQWPGSLPEDV